MTSSRVGWTVSISRVVARRVRGSIDYTVTTAEWGPSPDAEALAEFAPSAARVGRERLHDLTTSVQADIPVTATHVFALYRVNTAFVAAAARGRPAGRRRPFRRAGDAGPAVPQLHNAQWEMLFGIRNMFRELAPDASIYDELLVLRPPKRVRRRAHRPVLTGSPARGVVRCALGSGAAVLAPLFLCATAASGSLDSVPSA